MFSFQKKILAPLVRRIADSIDTALAKPDTASKLDGLLEANDAASRSFGNLTSQEMFRALMGGNMMIAIGGIALLAGIPASAGTTGGLLVLLGASAAVPLMAAGAALLAGGIAITALSYFRTKKIGAAEKTLNGKLHGEILDAALGDPAGASQSPRFQKFLRNTFRLSAQRNDADYTKLKASIAPVPAAAPK
jgi:hypothetical protein